MKNSRPFSIELPKVVRVGLAALGKDLLMLIRFEIFGSEELFLLFYFSPIVVQVVVSEEENTSRSFI